MQGEASNRQWLVFCHNDFNPQEVFPGDRVHGAIGAVAADFGIVDLKDVLFFFCHKAPSIRPCGAIGKQTLMVGKRNLGELHHLDGDGPGSIDLYAEEAEETKVTGTVVAGKNKARPKRLCN